MLTKYDPERAPDPQRWLAEDDQTKHSIVERFHRRAGIRIPNPRLHAIIHVVVENQVAMGDETPVAEAVARLMGEGLSRHDAIHAVGSALSRHLFSAVKGETAPDADLGEAYFADVRKLTKQAWYDEHADETEPADGA